MGKAIAVLLTAFAFQAVFAGVTRSTLYYHNHESLSDLSKQILGASVEVAETLQKNTGITYAAESRIFGDGIEEIVKKLEELKNSKEHEVATIHNICTNFQEISNSLKKLSNTSDETTIKHLKTQLIAKLKALASQIQSLVQYAHEEHVDGNLRKILTEYSHSIQTFQSTVSVTSKPIVIGEPEKELIRKLQHASDGLFQKIQEAKASRTETEPVIRLYIRDLAIVTEHLEKIDLSKESIKSLIEKLRNVLVLLNKFSHREEVSLEKLKSLLGDIPGSFEKLFLEDSSHVTEFKSIALQYISITKRFFNEFTSDLHPRYGRSEFFKNGKPADNIIKDLGDSLKNVQRDDSVVKQHLIDILDNYLECLKKIGIPHFESYVDSVAEILSQGTNAILDEIKKRIYVFVSEFKNEVDKLPEDKAIEFWKQTHKLQMHVHNINSDNHNHPHHLSLRIRTLADLLGSLLQTVSVNTTETKQRISAAQREFVQALEKVVFKAEKLEAPHEVVAKLRNHVAELGTNLDIYRLVNLIEVATTEFQKLLILSQNSQNGFSVVVFEYLNVLQWQWHAIVDIYGSTQHIEVISMHILATTNKLGMYFHSMRHTDEARDLVETTKRTVGKLENSTLQRNDVKNVVDHLKNIVEQYETNEYEVNDFLQKVALELKTLGWLMQSKDSLYTVVEDALMNYWVKLQRLYVHEKVHKGVNMLQARPIEAVFEIETIASRVSKTLLLVAPEYKHTKIVYQGRHLVQIFELALFRLHQWKKNEQVEEVYKNLMQIHSELEQAVTRPDTSLKIKLGVYLSDAVIQMKKLAVIFASGEDVELKKIFGDFWFGIKHIQSQIVYNLATAIIEPSTKALTMQVQFVAHRISKLLQRAQIKPQMKRVVFTQTEVFAREVGYLLEALQNISGDKFIPQTTTKLNKIHYILTEVTKTSSSSSVIELTAFLDTYLQTVVMSLENVAPFITHNSGEFNDAYRRFLSGITNVMIRLQNVHYYEYYGRIDSRELSFVVEKLSNSIATKLDVHIPEDKKTKKDVTIQILNYIERVSKIIERLQVDTHNQCTALLEDIHGLLQIVSQNNEVSLNEVKTKLALYVKKLPRDLEKTVKDGHHETVRRIMVTYLVTVEKLFINVQQIWVRSQHEQSLRQTVQHVETHARYFSKVLEHVSPSNKAAGEVLHNQFSYLVETVSKIAQKLQKTSQSQSKLQKLVASLSETKLGDTTEYKNIDDLKINLLFQAQRTSWALWELVWIYNLETLDEQFVKDSLLEFLNTVQDMHIQIAIKVLAQEKSMTPSFYIGDKKPWRISYKNVDGDYRQNPIKFSAIQQDTHKHSQINSENWDISSYEPKSYTIHKRNLQNGLQSNYDDKLVTNNFEDSHEPFNDLTKKTVMVSSYARNNEVQELDQHVNEFLQVLDKIMDNIKTKETKSYAIHYIVKNLGNIKNELKEVTQATVMRNIRYQLADIIERVAFEIERVSRFVNGDKAYVLFLNYIRSLKSQSRGHVPLSYQNGLPSLRFSNSNWYNRVDSSKNDDRESNMIHENILRLQVQNW